jgi:glycerol-3-phosphate dehydrogenase (NAD(P)+)
MILQRAHARGIEMPIVDAVVQVLDGRLAPEQALEQLLRRDARAEGL